MRAMPVRCLLLSGVSLLLTLPIGNVDAQPQPEQPVRLSLGDAARLAAKQNGAVEMAQARVEQAEARARQRRSALFPDLAAAVQQAERTLNSATFGFSFINPATGKPMMRPDGEILGPVPTIDFRYRVQAPLLDLGRVAGWRAAQAATSAASADVSAQASSAAALAAATYVRAARSEAQMAARQADSVLAADLLRIARDQLAAGTGIALDVTRAEAQLAAVRAQLLAARGERARTLLELGRVTGVATDVPVVLADSLAGLPFEQALPSEAAAVNSAVQQRPDLRLLRAQERAQQQQVQAIRWERMPQIGLLVEQGVIGRDMDRLLPTYTWGVQLSMGLFDGYRRTARLQEQVAITRETEARRRDVQAQGTMEARAALLDLQSAQEQVEASRERTRLAEQEVRQAQDRFAAGVAGNADVIAALLSLNQARTLRNDALAAYHTARVMLAKAMGDLTRLQ